ncbi:N-acetyltransferase [Sphingomonas lacunae]|uniref:N-acetyltransferase n=1 Tax=Sphingomonas lacunae TaxID=2698828 RepID=A0A6M4AQA6_9SPHN|nr:N-acetyltransferase [Sphingomonas lacunae]QJQ31197.1 N-acetyltransferase [Sphingomonas lacunae]
MAASEIQIVKVSSKTDRREFVELTYRLNRGNPNWVPPLKMEVYGLLDSKKNPWFGHGQAQLFLARRDERTVGRICAHIDFLAHEQPVEQGFGPGTGFWGLFEAEDDTVAAALLDTAEQWLRAEGMNKMIGPVSLSMWDEPGLLVGGFDNPPTIMMGYNIDAYQDWVEAHGHAGVQDLYTYGISIDDGLPELANRIVAMGEKAGKITIRKADKSRFDEEAKLLLGILNNAWSDNWGFVPLTDAEIAYAGKKLKDVVYEDLVRFAMIDGETVAFMMTLPDLNEKLRDFDGSLFPFNWARLLWWMRAPKVRTMRVPLMGVVKHLQGSRTASQLALMLVEYIRRDAVGNFGATHGDFGWVLASNRGMTSVGEAVGGTIDKTYRIYQKMI